MPTPNKLLKRMKQSKQKSQESCWSLRRHNIFRFAFLLSMIFLSCSVTVVKVKCIDYWVSAEPFIASCGGKSFESHALGD